MPTTAFAAVRSPALATVLAAGAALAGATDARAFSAYHEATLDNGLRVVLIEHHANPVVASSVVVGAGVVHEPEGRSGASHLLEHLLFNGTATRTQRQLYDDVDRLGAYNNATTREDHTLFQMLVQREFVAEALDIQADMLFRSTVPPENYDKEKGIVLEEMARDDSDPGYAAREGFRAFAYAGTPLARPVLGTSASIAAVGRDEVVEYYRTRYVPSNMLLVVMGDFETDAMLATVGRAFGGATGRAVAPTAAAGAWPAVPERNLMLAPLDAPRTYVHAAFPLGVPAHDPLVPAVELLLAAAADGDDAPLQRALTQGASPAALDADAGLTKRAGPWTTVELSATVPKGQAWQPALHGLAAALVDLGPTSAARARVAQMRTRRRADEILATDQVHYYAMTHSDGLLEAPPGYLARSAGRFDAVTDEQLAAAADLLARASRNLRAHVAGPGLEAATAAWPVPAAPPAPPSVGRPVERRARTLGNGTRLSAERNDDSAVFAVHLALAPRSASEPAGLDGSASFVHRLMTRGTQITDAAGLSARLARLGATLKTDDDPRVPFDDYYTTPAFSFVRMEMPAEAWREGVALTAELLRLPRLEPDDLEAVRREMLDLLAKREASSRNRAVDTLERAMAPGHPLTRPVLGTPESLAAITADNLRAFHGEYVSGRRLIATVVGPVPPEEVLDALESAFGTLPAGPERAPAPSPPVGAPPGATLRAGELREQITVAVGQVFEAAPEDRAALALAGAMLSDALAFDLRETRGLAYSLGASIGPWGGRTRLVATMGTRAANVDEAIAGLREGIAKFDPGDDAAVRRAANALRGRTIMRRMTRVQQAYGAGLAILEGRPETDDLTFADALLRVDAARVREAYRRYIDPSRLTIAVE